MRLRWDTGPGLDVTDGGQLDQALDALLAGQPPDCAGWEPEPGPLAG
jgi:hypothetical protein